MNTAWVVPAVIAALCILLYGRTLPFPFLYDDCLYLKENPLLADVGNFPFLSNFSEFAIRASKLGLDPDISTNMILRPVTYYTFYLNQKCGGMTPEGFRVVNIVIHFLNACLVFGLLSTLLRHSPKGATLSAFSRRFIPAAVALLFTVHPLMTESVTYIVQRFTSLITLFYLAALLTHLKANAASGTHRKWLWRVLSFVCVLASMLTKESGMTAPLAMVLLDRIIMGTRWRVAFLRALPQLLCLPLIPILVVLVSMAQNQGVLSIAHALNIANSNDAPGYHLHYLLTQITVLVVYLPMILFPYKQCIAHSYPLVTSLQDPRVWGSAALLLSLVVTSWFLYRRRRGDLRLSMILAFLLWFFVTQLVSSGVAPLADLLVEHRTYLASIGMLTLLVCVADFCRTLIPRRRLANILCLGGMALWTASLGRATLARNEVWRSGVSLWTNATTVCPGKARAWMNLAFYQHDERRDVDALNSLETSIKLDPKFGHAYMNLSILHIIRHEFSGALSVADSGLRLQNSFVPQLHYARGVALCGLGRVEDGRKSLEHTLALMPAYAPAHLSIALICVSKHDLKGAIHHYKTAVLLGRTDPELCDLIERLGSSVASAKPAM